MSRIQSWDTSWFMILHDIIKSVFQGKSVAKVKSGLGNEQVRKLYLL